ncbi:hypothetical protein SH449x_003960 [Pirellulaceae bacterium SH449]
MASPFEIFRKNQRILMAAAVLLAMFAFVIAPMFESMQGRSGGGGGPNPVIASWRGGAIRYEQAQKDELDLQVANRFLSELAREVIQKGGIPQVPDFRPDMQSLGITPGLDLRSAAFRRMLITEAENLGIQFDDNSVKVFLEKFVNGKLSGETIVTLMKRSTDRRMSMSMFNRIMKDELAYQHMLRLTNAGLVFQDLRDSRLIAEPILLSPSRSWREFLQLNRTAKIQAYPVYVKDFLDGVTVSPTDKELKDLYAEGKEIIRNANLLESAPAFMTAPKADIEFVTIDTEAVVQAEMAKISEEVLRAAYEKRVAEKQYQEPIELPQTPATEPATTNEPISEATTQATEPLVETPPATESVAPPPTVDPPATEPPATEPPATEPPVTGGDGNGGEDKQSRAPVRQSPVRDNAVRLVSYQEGDTQTELGNPLRQESATTATDAPPVATVQEVTAEAASGNATQGEASLEQEAVSTPVEQGTQVEQGLQIGDADVPQTEEKEAEAVAVPMRTKTFDEVRDELARELATPKALSIIDEKMQEVIDVMTLYNNDLEGYQRAQEERLRGFEMPVRPDLKKLADELGLDYGTTGLVDSDTVQLTPIGQSSVSQGMRGQPIPVSLYINATQGPGAEFVPLTSASDAPGGNRFAFWKTKVEGPVVPSFEAAREQVTEVWKLQQAIKLAESKAKELATRASTGSLEDALTTDEEKKLVVEPVPFTAMDRLHPMLMRLSPQYQGDGISRVDPLQPVDGQFMDGVFSTKPGQAVAVPDRRRSVFYVVKVIELYPSTEVLLNTFMQNPNQNVDSLEVRNIQQARTSLFDSIEKRLGFRLY